MKYKNVTLNHMGDKQECGEKGKREKCQPLFGQAFVQVHFSIDIYYTLK